MNPNGNDPATHRHEPPDDDAFDQFLHDVRGSLSVIQANTQMLERRIHQGRTYDEQHLLAHLAVIEQSAKAINTRLKEHEDRLRP